MFVNSVPPLLAAPDRFVSRPTHELKSIGARLKTLARNRSKYAEMRARDLETAHADATRVRQAATTNRQEPSVRDNNRHYKNATGRGQTKPKAQYCSIGASGSGGARRRRSGQTNRRRGRRFARLGARGRGGGTPTSTHARRAALFLALHLARRSISRFETDSHRRRVVAYVIGRSGASSVVVRVCTCRRFR